MAMPKLTPVRTELKKILKQLQIESKAATGEKKKMIEKEIVKVDMLVAVVSFVLKNHNIC